MGSHGHKPWLWPYRWGDSAHPPICARGSRHLITVIYSCRILHFSITQIHRDPPLPAPWHLSKHRRRFGPSSSTVCVNCVLFTQDAAANIPAHCIEFVCLGRVSLVSRGHVNSRVRLTFHLPAHFLILTIVCPLSSFAIWPCALSFLEAF